MAISTEHVIPAPAKSPAQREAALALYSDLQSRPVGTQRGEQFGMPINYVPPPARIYVVNHSRTMQRKRTMVAVSETRGADEALAFDKSLRQTYNADMMYRQKSQGRDMNIYKTEIHPVAYNLRIPGGPNRAGGSIEGHNRPIPPAVDPEQPPLRVEVPEGTWDLYLGNFDRMHSEDPKVRAEERSRLAVYWRYRHNPVFKYTVDGESFDATGRPWDEKHRDMFGFLEFIRETNVPVRENLDKEYLTALDLVEVI